MKRIAFLFSALLAFGMLAPLGAHAQEGVPGGGNIASQGHPPVAHVPHSCPAVPGDEADEECLEYWESHINWWSWDYKAGPDQALEHRHMPPPFGWAFINFVIFGAILYKLAARPLADFVRTRHTVIRKDLDDAAELHREAEARLREYEQKIAGLDGELEALRAQVRQEAEAEKARIIAGAEQQAKRLAEEAEAQIAVETERVRRELKTEVVNAAMTAAVGLLRKHTDADDQARLTERFVEELEGPRARSAAST